MSFFNKPKIPKVSPTEFTPATPANTAETRDPFTDTTAKIGYASMVSTSPTGLQTKSKAGRRSLIGGSGATQ